MKEHWKKWLMCLLTLIGLIIAIIIMPTLAVNHENYGAICAMIAMTGPLMAAWIDLLWPDQ